MKSVFFVIALSLCIFSCQAQNTAPEGYTLLDEPVLEADFNGDGVTDIAKGILQEDSGKKGLLILHRQSGSEHIVGAGKDIGNGGDDLSWVQDWLMIKEKSITNVIADEDFNIIGEEVIELKGMGLYLRSESGGGVVYWDGEQYKWVQYGD